MENSNTPWTPGPWVAEEADFFGDHNIILADSAGDSSAIAAVVSNLRPALEVANNASLIAAAPEMAEALRELRDNNRKGVTGSKARDTWTKVNAILASIEGKS